MTSAETINRKPTDRLGLVDKALIVGAGTSASLLAGAHVFQHFGYPPCALCLDQREAHWAALLITSIGLIISFGFRAPRLAAAAAGTASLIYAFSAGLAFYHTGIEFSFWPGPASCSGHGQVTNAGDLALGFDPDRPRVTCGEAAWRLFGISMAGYNLLASAGLFALTIIAATRAVKQARRSRRD